MSLFTGVGVALVTLFRDDGALDLGEGRFAFYAHLRPGTVAVRGGERVPRGQQIGELGNSGNSHGAHLHFHLMDGTSPLGSEGIPYVIDSFDLVGRCARLIAGCTRLPTPETRRREMPLANEIVRFPD